MLGYAGVLAKKVDGLFAQLPKVIGVASKSGSGSSGSYDMPDDGSPILSFTEGERSTNDRCGTSTRMS